MDVDVDMDGKFHIHGNPGNKQCIVCELTMLRQRLRYYDSFFYYVYFSSLPCIFSIFYLLLLYSFRVVVFFLQIVMET